MARFFSSLGRHSVGGLLWLNLALLVAIKVAVPIGSFGLAAITEFVSQPDAAQVVAQTNAARTSAGVQPLARNAKLDSAAQQKLDDMAENDYFAHVGPAGEQAWDFIRSAGYSYQSAGENLGRGFTDPAALVNAWMGSPSHRANIVSVSYRDVGIAVGKYTLDGKPATVVVQLFGAPRVAAAPSQAAPSPAASSPAVAKPAPVAVNVPQNISTEPAIAPVSAPVPVITVAGAESSVPAAATAAASNAFMVYLTAIVSLLAMVIGRFGWDRRTTFGLMAHAAILFAAVALPQAVPAARFIF